MKLFGENEAIDQHCIQCNQPISQEARYCNYCGTFQMAHKVADTEENNKIIGILTIFFGIFLLVCLISNFTGFGRGLIALFVSDGILSIVTIGYAAYFWKDLKKLFRWAHFSIIKFIAYASAASVAAVLVNYLARWLNKTIFDSESYYYYAFSHLKYARLVTILVVALQPAIFEELAFRGVLQEGLNKITDRNQAIFVSAFLFALLHMSIISFLWLLPFALWLGYIRNREKTIWYGVVIHFFFNGTACFLEFFELNLF